MSTWNIFHTRRARRIPYEIFTWVGQVREINLFVAPDRAVSLTLFTFTTRDFNINNKVNSHPIVLNFNQEFPQIPIRHKIGISVSRNLFISVQVHVYIISVAEVNL